MARLKYWTWLSCIHDLRPLTKFRLTEALNGPDGVFFASRDELLSAGATEKEADLLSDKSMADAERVLSLCGEKGISILTLQDATYPERLRNIPDPPAVLYIQGKLPPVDEIPMIAVVGTRHATPYGLRIASKLGREITEGGGVVVSGLAEGCDRAAMEAALAAGGIAVGVLGTAIDVVYPRKNEELFQDVRMRGALVSEYPPGMRTYPPDFRVRNRIITGLSLGVVVAEAPARSGTRVTVNHALDQNRDVFAVPGNADAAAAAGCNDLIAQGAVLVTGGREVLAEYASRNDLFRREIAPTHIKKQIDKPRDIVYIDTEKLENLPDGQRRVLKALKGPAMHPDELIEATGLTAAETMAALTMLELGGYVVCGAGRRYSRKSE